MSLVATFRPIAGGSNNGSSYASVDEETADGDTTKISTSAAKLYTFAIPNPELAGTISRVKVLAWCKDVEVYCVEDGVYYHGYAKMALYTDGQVVKYGTNNTLSTSYVLKSYEWITNPWTGNAWTWDELNALEIGISMYGDWYTDPPFNTVYHYATAYCTQIYAEVTYIPPASRGAQLIGPVW